MGLVVGYYGADRPIAAIRPIYIQGAAKKSSPPKFFAVFSATVWSFVEFFLQIYILIYYYLSAK